MKTTAFTTLRWAVSTLLLAVMVSATVLVGTDQAEAAQSPRDIHVVDNLSQRVTGPAFVPNEVVYRLKGDREHFRVLRVPDVAQAIEALAKDPKVEYVEPNYVMEAYSVPNDPYFKLQWNFANHGGGVYAPTAWDITSGENEVVVAVIDTGVLQSVDDLQGTCFVAGHDYVNNDSNPADDNGHGTHVTGTIAGATNNNRGVAGLAYHTCIMPMKVLSSSGSGSDANVAQAIIDAADAGVEVVNLSLGGPGSNALKNAVQYAYGRGVTIVAAAGNEGQSAIGYPAAYPEVISVGATRYDEKLAPYSNYGTNLDIVAPGGDTAVDQNADGYVDGILQQTFNRVVSRVGYYFFQGTSMAAPHVAAAAALVIANGNATDPDDVRDALESSAKDLGTPGKDNFYGYGLLNIPGALAWSSGPSDTPPSVKLTVPSFVQDVEQVTIGVETSDDNGVTQVDIEIDGNPVTSTTTAVFDYVWNLTGVTDGDHVVAVTVYDGVNNPVTESVVVTVDLVVDPFVLAVAPRTSGKTNYADLSWNVLPGFSSVTIYRNGGVLVNSTANDGSHTDKIGRSGSSYTYKVCEFGSATRCSNLATVSF